MAKRRANRRTREALRSTSTRSTPKSTTVAARPASPPAHETPPADNGSFGEPEQELQHLGEAVDAYRSALLEYTRERVPLDWAMTQDRLGNALSMLGERETGTARLQEAVDAFAPQQEPISAYIFERARVV